MRVMKDELRDSVEQPPETLEASAVSFLVR